MQSRQLTILKLLEHGRPARGPKKAFQKKVLTTWFGTAGREAIFMSKPHLATAEAQHEGSNKMQCISPTY